MVKSLLDWKFSVDRGPDCLFVKIRLPDRQTEVSDDLADELWSILSKHFIYRLVLEMDEVDRLPNRLIGELVTLKARIQQHGGMLRLCGLSDSCREMLNAAHPRVGLPSYQDRADAVVGHHADCPP